MATATKNSRSNLVVARDAIVVNVGGRPDVYNRITVIDNKTGVPVEIQGDTIIEDGDEGVPYAFKAFQKVNKNHPAVLECPGAFMSMEEAGELDLVDAA